jgi:hypothetical protein
MAAGMADALIKRFEHNETGLLEKVDLGAYLPQASKDKLMEPIRETEPMEVFPEVDIAAFDH